MNNEYYDEEELEQKEIKANTQKKRRKYFLQERQNSKYAADNARREGRKQRREARHAVLYDGEASR